MNASAVTSDLSELVSSAADSFARAATPADLENAKALFLGKAGRVTELMKGLGALSIDEKKSRGAAINQAKQAIEAHFGPDSGYPLSPGDSGVSFRFVRWVPERTS